MYKTSRRSFAALPLGLAVSSLARLKSTARAQSQPLETDSMFRGNPARTGETEHTGPDGNQSLDVLWEVPTGKAIFSSAAIWKGIACVGSNDGLVYGIDAKTGKSIWTFDTGVAIDSSPLISGRKLFISDMRGGMHALDVNTGDRLWAQPIGGKIASSPVLVEESIYIASTNGNVHAMRENDGAELWRFEADSSIVSSPTVWNDSLYIGTRDGTMHSLSRSTGEELWRFTADDEISGTATVDEERVYVGSHDGNLYAIDRTDGLQLWRFPTGGRIESSPALSGGRVFAGTRKGEVIALDATLGTEQWITEISDSISSSPTIAQKYLYIGDDSGRVFAISHADGIIQWTVELVGRIGATPAIVDGMVIVGSTSRSLYAIGNPIPVLEEGATAATIVATDLLGAPAPSAVIREQLPAQTMVLITGPTESNGDQAWWPVTVQATGAVGWIDEAALDPVDPDLDLTPPSEDATDSAITVIAKELIFDPNEITIPADTDVTISLINEGVLPHDFVVDELGVASQLLSAGESIEFAINAPKGTYEAYCSEPGHAAAGMVAAIVVV